MNLFIGLILCLIVNVLKYFSFYIIYELVMMDKDHTKLKNNLILMTSMIQGIYIVAFLVENAPYLEGGVS